MTTDEKPPTTEREPIDITIWVVGLVYWGAAALPIYWSGTWGVSVMLAIVLEIFGIAVDFETPEPWWIGVPGIVVGIALVLSGWILVRRGVAGRAV